MEEHERIILITLIITGIFLTIGLYTIFYRSNQYYEDTEILHPNSEIVLETRLQRGDRVRINLSTLQNKETRIKIAGGSMNYRVHGSDVDITIPISKEADYRFEILNPNESYIFVSYLYEISYLHSFYTGITAVIFSVSLVVALLFRFRQEFMEAVSSLRQDY